MIITNRNNVVLLLIIVGVVIFFTFVMPIVDNTFYKIPETFNSSSDYSPVINATEDDSKLVKIDTKKCSTSCCGLTQWPVPSELLDPSMTQDELKNYIPSNFGCAAGNSKGCVCITQQNYNYLNNHGNNI